jgi:ArsR family transcriptional regulator
MPNENEKLSGEALELVAKRFALLGEPMRLKLLQELMDGEKNVSTLVELSGSTQANVSRHLQTMAREGILSRRRSGLQVFYAIEDTSVFDMCSIVCGGIREKIRRTGAAMG